MEGQLRSLLTSPQERTPIPNVWGVGGPQSRYGRLVHAGIELSCSPHPSHYIDRANAAPLCLLLSTNLPINLLLLCVFSFTSHVLFTNLTSRTLFQSDVPPVYFSCTFAATQQAIVRVLGEIKHADTHSYEQCCTYVLRVGVQRF